MGAKANFLQGAVVRLTVGAQMFAWWYSVGDVLL